MPASQVVRAQGSYIQRGATSVVAAQTISSISAVGTLATVTTAIAHGLATGAIVTLAGQAPTAYAGVFNITVLTATTFTYSTAVAPGGAATTVGTYTALVVVYATIEESADIKLGGLSVSSIDVTNLLSTSKEFIAGLKDSGSCDIMCNFTNGVVQALARVDCNNGVTSPYRLQIPSGTQTISISFSGFITKYAGPDPKVDGKLAITITVKITGDITIVTA